MRANDTTEKTKNRKESRLRIALPWLAIATALPLLATTMLTAKPVEAG